MKLTLKEAQEIMEKNNGNLDLRRFNITSLPKNLVVPGWLDLSGSQITSLPDGLYVNDSLYLSRTRINRLPKDLKVDGWIELSGSQITSLPDNLTVNGRLNLSNTPLKSLPKGLMVKDELNLKNTLITSLPEDLVVGGNLDLKGTMVDSIPNGLIIGGSLDLIGTPIDSLPENLTVGGWIYLTGTNVKKLPRNLKVGGKVLGDQFKGTRYKRLKNGECIPEKYLYADNTLIHLKERKNFNGYTAYIGKIKGKSIISDGKNYARCSELVDGIIELLYKQAIMRGTNQYKHLTKESVLSLNEALVMYRVITKVSKVDIGEFVAKQKKLKEEYTVGQIIEITRGELGSSRLEDFFEA